MALEVIEQARVYSGNSPYVFRSKTNDDAPIITTALSNPLMKYWKEIGIEEKYIPHDLRRTVRTRLAELRVDDVVAERIVGHKLQGMLKVYNRHDYSVEKRKALVKWESKLRQIVGLDDPETENVIEMRKP